MENSIFDELKNAILTYEAPSEYFEPLLSSGGLDSGLGEIKALIGVPQNQNYHREGDVWTHTMMVVDEAAKRRDKVKNPIGFMLVGIQF